MSKICPQCRKVLKRVDFEAWVLKVRGSAILDDEGAIASLSPLQSVTTIKIGQELNHTSLVTCPECGIQTFYKEFATVRTCWLTGDEACVEIDFPYVGKKWISDTADWKSLVKVLQQSLGFTPNEELVSCVV